MLAVPTEKKNAFASLGYQGSLHPRWPQGRSYLRFPTGCGSVSRKVYKVELALYGLKQSGRGWGHEDPDTLVENKYEQRKADPCISRKIVNGEVVSIIVIYLHDRMFMGSEKKRMELLTFLQKKLPVQDLGECKW